MTIGAGIVDHDVFWQGYEILKASTLELTEFKSSFLKGIIQCDRDGLLYTSIPQNGNWEVRVDGKQAETVLIGDCMVGVMLTQGQHVMEYTYRNGALALGWKVSLLCAVVFVIMIARADQTATGKKRGKYQR